jgi:hypothetical protein
VVGSDHESFTPVVEDVGGGQILTEDLAHQLLARSTRERAEPHFLQRALRPELRERVVNLAARDGEHHEASLVRGAKRGVEQVHAGKVAPVQILEDEHERGRARLGEDEVAERATHLIAHQRRIRARRAKLHAVGVVPRNARDLAEEFGHARDVFFGDVARDTSAELLLTNHEGLAAGDTGTTAQESRHERER